MDSYPAASDARSTVTGRVVDAYTNIHSVKMFAHHDREMEFAREAERSSDCIVNSSKEGEAYELVSQAWRVYEQKDYDKGLELARQATP